MEWAAFKGPCHLLSSSWWYHVSGMLVKRQFFKDVVPSHHLPCACMHWGGLWGINVPAEVEWRSYAKAERILTLQGEQEGGMAEAEMIRYFRAIIACVVSQATSSTVSSVPSETLDIQSCHLGYNEALRVLWPQGNDKMAFLNTI